MSLVIYHGGCDDGFAAAYAIWKAHPEFDFYPGVYQQEPPDVSGREVYLVDFSYKRPVVEKMLERAHSITIIDHHATAEEDLKPLLERHALFGGFDQHHCGAFLAWDHFHSIEHNPPPDWFHYIEDRDLWRRTLPHTDQVTMAIRSYPQEFQVWDRFDLRALQQEGIAIHRYYRLRVEEAKKLAQIETWPEGRVAVANANFSLASEVAGELCQERDVDFGAVWWMNSDGSRTYSLRSRGTFNVAEVAKARGGGGHVHAAGFRVGVMSQRDERPEPELTPRERQVVALVVAGQRNQEIGATLGISIKTVEVHRSSLYKKLRVQNTAQLFAAAVRLGLVNLERNRS